MNPFDIVTSVTNTKKRIISSDNESEYNAFMVNRALSYYPDTILHAQEMNVYSHLDALLQYDYLLNSIRKKKRFSKWFKREKSEILDAVMRRYNCSYRKALEITGVLTKDQLDDIKRTMTNGTE
jgi:hypothetical protein